MQLLKQFWITLKRFIAKEAYKMSAEERRQFSREFKTSITPGFDYYLLVILSCGIATLGLMIDSAAVIIGAMLLAPLMTPIIGVGFASLIDDKKLLLREFIMLAAGACLAVAMAAFITLISKYLPVVSLAEIPKEILARTNPSPIDLMIALTGGIAASYALTRPKLSAALPGVAIATALMPPLCTIGIGLGLGNSTVSGGALLLFITNAVAIAFASILIFFIRGFGRIRNAEAQRVPGSLLFTTILISILLIPLFYFSLRFFSEAKEYRFIQTVVADEINKLEGSELVDLKMEMSGEIVNLALTIRTSSSVEYNQVVAMQESLVEKIQQPVSLKLNQVFAEKLDPLNPPTPTPTQLISPTPTLRPTSTPRPSATPTPEPIRIQVKTTNSIPKIAVYQNPGGPMIGTLKNNDFVAIQHESMNYSGLVWVKIIDEEGRIGWIPQIYLITPTALPSSQ